MFKTVAEQIVSVGLGEIQVAAEAGTVLMALGLGSCIGIAVYDPQVRVGGMAHVVLPEPLDPAAPASAKFATVAVPELLARVEALGAERRRLICKIAGGAQVLQTAASRHNFRIGERNIEAVNAALAAAGLAPCAQDCGGKTGRSVQLNVLDGRVAVKRLGRDWEPL